MAQVELRISLKQGNINITFIYKKNNIFIEYFLYFCHQKKKAKVIINRFSHSQFSAFP
jgi:hypothetical protein